MRTKRQQIDAVVATREFLKRLGTRGAMCRIPHKVRIEAAALLAQFPFEEDVVPILEAHLSDAPPPPPRKAASLVDWIRQGYRRTPLATPAPADEETMGS